MRKHLKTATYIIYIIYIICSILLSQFVASLLAFAIFGENYSENTYAVALFYLFYVGIAVALIFFAPKLVSKTLKITRENLGLTGLPTFADLALGPIGCIATLILGTISSAIMSKFSFFDANESQDVGFNYLTSSGEKFVTFFVLCLIIPIFEELIFRGIIYYRLRTTIKSPKKSLVISILVTSLLFAILHGQWNVAVVVFWMSVIACIYREITGSTYAGIILHIIKNSLAFYLLYVVGSA